MHKKILRRVMVRHPGQAKRDPGSRKLNPILDKEQYSPGFARRPELSSPIGFPIGEKSISMLSVSLWLKINRLSGFADDNQF